MATTTEHIAARDDVDLQKRLIAAAEQMGIENAASRVAASLGALVAKPISVNGEETTISKVHAYAADVRRIHLTDDKAMPPGLNPGAVTDIILEAAIAAVLQPTETGV